MRQLRAPWRDWHKSLTRGAASGTSLVTVHWVFRCYPQTRFAWTVVCGIYFVATVPVACSDRVRLNRPLRIWCVGSVLMWMRMLAALV